MNAVDANWNLVNAATDVVGITSTDASATLPANAALLNGTGSFNVTLKTAGSTTTVMASDITDGTKTADTSPSITVGAGGFAKLQLLVPGETAAPGTTSGKTGTPSPQAAGTPFAVTVNAVDADWNLVNAATDVVGITSTDASATLPANAALLNGTGSFNVTLKTAGSTTTVMASDITDGTKTADTSPSITVSAGTLHHFAIATIGPQTAGTAFNITITAQDEHNNTVPGFTSTVNLSTTAGTITPTVSGTFLAGTFTQSVTVTQAGPGKEISVSDGSHNGTSNTFDVSAGGFAKLQLLVPGETAAPGTTSGKTGTPSPQAAGTPFAVTVNAVDADWNLVNAATDVVGITSTDASATLPANAALLNGTGSFNVTLKTAGSTTTVMASDITDGTKTADTSPSITVSAGTLHHFAIATIGPQTAGTAFNITITAQDEHNNTVPGFTSTVNLSTTAGTITPTVSGTFLAGTFTQSVTVTQAGPGKEISVSDGSHNGTSNTFDVSAGGFAKLQLLVPGETAAPGTTSGKTGTPSPQAAGTPFAVTVNAVDADWNLVNAATDVVGITSTDASATLPANAALLNGTGSFNVTLKTAGSTTTVMASDITDGTKTADTSPSITVGAGGFAKLQLLVPGETAAPGTTSGKTGTPSPQAAGTPFAVTVNAVDADWNLVNAATDVVGITSTDASATLPANAALLNGTGSFNVTLKTAGSTTTVMASDITDGTKTADTSPSITVSAGTLHHFAIATIGPQTAGTAFNITITAQDEHNNTVPGFTSTVNLSTTAGTITPTVSGTFLAGTFTQSVTVTQAGPGKEISVSDGSHNGTSNTFDVSAGGFAKLQLLVPGETAAPGTTSGKTGTPSPQAAGTPFAVTVNAVDADWNLVNAATDVVGITSTDASATLPANAALLNGTGSFNVTLKTAGSTTTVMASDITDGTKTADTSPSITVSAGTLHHFAIATIGPQTAGTAFNITITAQDEHNNTVPGFTSTVNLSTTAGTITPTVSGTFLAGTFTQSVTVTQAGPGKEISVSDGSHNGTSNTFDVSAGGFAKLQLLVPGETAAPGTTSGKTGTPSPQAAGTPFAVTVNAVDADWNLVNAATDVVGITSTDASATLPANAALLNGTGSFNVTLKTAGSTTTVMASDITDGTKTADTSPSITVGAGGFAKLQLLVPGETAAPGTTSGKTGTPSPQAAGTPFAVTVNAVDADWNLVNAATDVVGITSTDASATLPANAALLNGTGSFNVTLKTAGSTTTVMASDITDGTKTADTSPSITVSAGTLHHFAIATIGPQTAGTAFNITITAQDEHNNTVPGFTSTVNLSTTAGTITPTVSGTFLAGTFTQSVTVTQAGPGKEISVSDGSHNGTSNTFDVSAGGFAKLQLLVPGETAAPGTTSGKTGTPSPQAAGTPFAVTVNAVDADWNLVNAATDVVGITSTDASATLPANAALLNGTGSFNVTLKTAGSTTTVMASDITDGTKTADTSPSITVSAGTLHHFAIATIGPQTAGTAFNITITAQDEHNNTVPGFTSTVNLSTTAGTITPTVSGTFLAGTFTQSVTVTQAGPGKEISVSDGSHNGTSNTFDVSAGGFAKLQLLVPGETAAPGTTSGKTGTPSPQAAGTPFAVTVNAVDADWNLVNAATDVVGITSTDASATLPANAALLNGTGSFNVTLKTAGSTTTVMASDITDGTKTADTSPSITVGAGGFAKLQLLVPGETAAPGTTSGKTGTPSPQAAGTPFAVTVNAVDADWNLVNAATDVVGITSTDASATLPANAALLNGTGSFNVTLKTAGSTTTVMASDITDGTKTADTSPSITVSAGTLHHFAIATIGPQTAGTAFNITITAQDEHNNTVPGFTSTVNLSTTAGTITPTVSGTFLAGTFTQSVTVTQAGPGKEISVSDGSHNGTSNTFDVSAGALSKFVWSLASPQASGVAFTGTNTLTAQDAYGNTVTSFDAFADHVIVTVNAPLSGTVTGLGSEGLSVLDRTVDFPNGVANLTEKMTFTGSIGTTGTFTAAGGTSGKTGTSDPVFISGTSIVTSPTATNINVSTATLGADVTSEGGASVTERGVVWALTADPTTSDPGKATTTGTTGAFTVPATGLAPGTLYHYRGYAVNSVGTGYSPDATFTTLVVEPDLAASAMTFTDLWMTAMTVRWTSGGGSNRIVIAKAGSDVTTPPTDATTYLANAAFGTTGTDIVPGEYVVFNGSGNSVYVTGLSPGTTYYFRVYEYNGTNSSTNYLTTAHLDGSQATDKEWTGSIGTSWNTAGNWNPPAVPTSTENIDIPGTFTNQPSIDENASCANITILSEGTVTFDTPGKTLSVSGRLQIAGNGHVTFSSAATLEIKGQFNNGGGGFSAGAGTVLMSGSGGGFIVAPTTFNNLTIDNSSTVGVADPIVVNGTLRLANGPFANGTNLTLGNGATISRGAGSLSSAPTFTSTVNVDYTGSVGVPTGNELPTDPSVLSNLTIDNPGGVTLSANATVNGALVLTNGTLTTNAYTITLGPTATLTEGAGKTVLGNITTTRNVIATSGPEAFGNIGADITLQGTALGNTTVFRKTGTASSGSGHNSIKRYFDITPETNTGLNADMVFHYDDTELNSENASTLELYKSGDGGTTWNNHDGTVNTSARTISATGINDFSRWTAADASNPLGNTPGPTTTSISPTSATAGDPTFPLTVNGTNFVNGKSTVRFNGIDRTTTYVNSAQLTASILATDLLVAGLYPVTVFNTGGGGESNAQTFTVNVGAADHLAFSVQPTNAVAGATISPAVTVQLKDALGNNVPTSGVSVAMAISSGTGALSGTTPQSTDVTGLATFDNLSINLAGAKELTASSGVLTSAVSTSFTISAGGATQLVFVQEPTNTAAGATITPPVTVQLKDALGNNVPTSGVSVAMAISSGTGALSGTTPQSTDVTGLATFDNLSINLAGAKELTASSGVLTSAVSTSFTISAGGATQLVFVQEPTNAVAGATISPAVTVQLKDALGNNVPTSGVSVAMAISSGTGALSGTTPQSTDVTGLATFDNLSINLAGAKELTASSGVLTSAVSTSFTISAGGATQLVFVQEPTNAVAGATISPAVTVQLKDALGNNVPTSGVSVAMAISSGTGALSGTTPQSTDVTGLATFDNLSINLAGAKELTASSGVLTSAVSTSFTISAGGATQLVFVQEPTNAVAGATISPAVTVQLKDALGNNVPTSGVSVAMAISSGTGALSGTTPQSTDVTGLATFDNLSINLAGAKELTASSGVLTSAVSTSFTISAGGATQLVFVQEPTNAVAGATISPAVTVQLKDALGNNVPTSGVSVAMAISSGTGALSGTTPQSTDVTGLATFDNLSINLAGAKELTASSGVLTSAVSTSFTISAGGATQLVFVQEPTNTAAGATITPPVTVQLKDALGNNVPTSGVSVAMAISSGTGALSGTTPQSTDVTGLATFDNLSINLAGAKELTASSGVLTSAVSTSFTISAGGATQLVFVQEPTNAVAGATISPAVTVQLKDALGNNVPTSGVSVAMAISSGTGALSGTTPQSTDVTGLATFDNLSINLAGAKELTASSGVLTSAVSTSFTISAGGATQLVFVQEPTNAVAGATISPAVTVQLKDALGNNVPTSGVSVAMAISSGTGALSGTTPQSTDVTGLATFDNLSINLAGAKELTASSGVLTSAVSTSFTISAGGATQLVFVQEPTNAVAGATISPAVTVQLKDALGNNVPTSGVSVAMAISSGTGALSGTTPQSTDATGLATFDNLSINLAGAKELTASSGVLTSAVSTSFTISAGGATQLVFVQEPTNAVAGATISPAVTVQLKDALGNNVPTSGVSVAMAISSGTGALSGTTPQSTDVTGLATFDNLSINLAGAKELTASSGVLTSAVSTSFTISAGGATQLVFVQEPTNAVAGATISPAVTVQLKDALGNNVPTSGVSVAMAISSGTGALSGTTPQSTDVTGLATFDNLSINLAGAKELTASSGVLTSAVSTSFTISAGGATQLVFVQEPTNAVAGATISPAVTVQLKDALGNNVPTSGVSVAMAISSGTGALSGTTPQSTDVTGLATFDNLSINLAGAKELTASSGVLTSAVSTSFTISAGGATQLVFVQEPTNAVAGATISPAVTVQLKDALGNNVPTSGVSVAMAISSGTGALSGTTPQSTDVTGLATFDNLSINLAGAKELTASSGVLTSAVSTSFTISAGGATQLVFVQEPTNTAAGATITPPVTVQLKDALGNNVPTSGVSVAMAISSGTGALSGTTPQSTDVTGLATFDNLSINLAGAKELTASSGVLTSAVSTSFTISAGGATQLVFVQEPTNAVAGATISPAVTVQLKDALGNNVPTSGVSVAMAISSGTGALSGTTPQSTDVTGLATFDNLSINLAGAKELTASSGVLTSAVSTSFTISAGGATQLVFVQEPTNAVAGATISPAVTVQLKDALGNNVPTSGVSVAMAISSGTGALSGTTPQSTDVTGLATFDNLSINLAGAKELTASSGVLTSAVSTSFTISAGGATQLVFVQEPTNAVAGATISPAVTVQLKDALGNNVPTSGVSVAMAISSGTGALSGTTPQSTDVTGLATFDNLSINLAGAKELTASSGVLTSAVSTSFTISAGGATQLVFVQEPTNAVAGATISPAVTVQLKDALGNNVPTSGVSVAMAISSGTGALSGTTPQSTDATGLATFDNLSINLAGAKELTASSGVLTSAVSTSFTISAGGATQLVFVQEPTDAAAGATITPAVRVWIEDANGNQVDDNATQVSLAIGTNPPGNGMLTGGGAVTAVHGVATFSGLSIDKGGNGYTLSATSNPPLVAATSTTFDIIAIVVNAKVFLEGPYDQIHGNIMFTDLNTYNVIPTTDPYTGSQRVGSIPVGVVDWVLVQLRTGTASGTTVASRAAFLMSDGSVVDLDGSSTVTFSGLSTGNYYIVIRHRNHLPVMSKNVVLLSSSSSPYDFTTADQAYGTDAVKPLPGGGFAMVAGDVNVNGGIGASDLISVLAAVGAEVYDSNDVGMNGGVGASDLILVLSNVGQISQVP